MKKIQIMEPYFNKDELKSVKETLKSGWVTQGKRVEEFEKNFCDFHELKYGACVTSATAGLHLALLALNLKPGSEVIVPSFTWISSANCILYNNLKPRLIDIDQNTFNSSVDQILLAINEKTSAIIVVNLFGLLVNVKELKSRLPNKNIKIIEDSACATGSMNNNKFSGCYSDYSIFSFHPRKIITTGEGGMVVSKNKTNIEKIKILRDHGASSDDISQHFNKRPVYAMSIFNNLGYNYRMTDINAGIGVMQIKKLKVIISNRRKAADIYFKKLKSLSWLKLPTPDKSSFHTFQSFVCLINQDSKINRNLLQTFLLKKGITTRPGMHAIHNLDYYKRRFGYKTIDYPISNLCEKNSFALPIHNKLKKSDYNFISRMILKYK